MLKRVVFWEERPTDSRVVKMDAEVKEGCSSAWPANSGSGMAPGSTSDWASRVTAPFAVCQIDIMGPFMETPRGNLYILSFTDYVMRFSLDAPIKTKEAKTVATLLLFIVF